MTSCPCLVLGAAILCALLVAVSTERSYTASIEKIEVLKGEGIYYRDMKIKVTKFNRTITVVNGTVEILKDVPPGTMASVQTYEKLGTEYKKSMMLYKTVELCDFIKKEKKVYPDLLTISNLPKECPLNKGHYFIKNYAMNEENLPEKLPGEYWRLDLALTLNEEVIALVQVYVRIKHHVRRTMF